MASLATSRLTGSRWSVGSLVFAATGLLAAAAWAGFWPVSLPVWVRTVSWLQFILWLPVGLAAWVWWPRRPGRLWVATVLVVGATARLLLWPAAFELSDDAARYHWDGKVLCHGLNPFAQAPDDRTLAHLPDHTIDGRINHPWNITCYPPVAQVHFAAAYRISPGSLRGFHLVSLLAEVAAWLLLLRLLDRLRLPRAGLLLICWAPLVIFQGYLPGHVDTLILPWTVLFLSAVVARRPAAAGFWLAVACLIKPMPLFLLPAAWREVGRRGAVRLTVALGLTMVVAYVPFLAAGRDLFTSTWLMATDWSFNGSLGRLLELALPRLPAHVVAALLTAVLIGLATWRGRDFLQRALLSLTAFMVFTPTLFPWYLTLLTLLLALRPSMAVLWLVATVPLADEVVVGWRTQGLWEPALWPRLVAYLPFYSLLVWEGRQRWGLRWH